MFVRPQDVVKKIGLEPGMAAADFGAGSGHYAMALSKMVGSKGKVYAIDIQKELLAAIKSSAEINNFSNIEIIWSDLEKENGSRLANESMDFVIISNILFQAENKNNIIKEARRVLKEGGKTAVIEWSDGASRFGPQENRRVKKEECEELFKKSGLKKEREFEAGENHYGLLFMKHEA